LVMDAAFDFGDFGVSFALTTTLVTLVSHS